MDTYNADLWEFVVGSWNLNSSKTEPARPYHAILPRANLALDFQTDTLLVSYQQPYALRISELLSHPLKLSALLETRQTHKWHCSQITITLKTRPDSQRSPSDARDPELLLKIVGAPSPHYSNFIHRPQQLRKSSSVGSIGGQIIFNYVWRNPYP